MNTPVFRQRWYANVLDKTPLEEKWGKKYPLVLKSWQAKWDKLSSYFKYSDDICRLIYTTNSIESFHRQVRKFTKA